MFYDTFKSRYTTLVLTQVMWDILVDTVDWMEKWRGPFTDQGKVQVTADSEFEIYFRLSHILVW